MIMMLLQMKRSGEDDGSTPLGKLCRGEELPAPKNAGAKHG